MSQSPASSERRMTPELMITGEAVALEVTPISVGVRLLSGLIDYGLYAMGLFVTFLTITVTIESSPGLPSQAVWTAIIMLMMFLWMVLVPVTVEVLTRGRSAGRFVTGTRLVRDDGGSVRLRHTVVRVLVGSVEIWLTSGILAVGTCIVTRRGKRLGDMLAGTYAVRDDASSRDAPPLIMPPELAAWASQADLRALPGNLALVGRTFLQRASTMRPDARARIAIQLAAEVEAHVAPPPPPGTHPERFLAAVLVARRDRELMFELRDRRSDEGALAALDQLPYEIPSPRRAGAARP